MVTTSDALEWTVKIIGPVSAVFLAWFRQRKPIPKINMERPSAGMIDNTHYRLGRLEKDFVDFKTDQDQRHAENQKRLDKVQETLEENNRDTKRILMSVAKIA